MKTVLIAGQFYPDFEDFDWNNQNKFGELWMVNAFFDFYPKASPDRIYQIHSKEHESDSHRRQNQMYSNYDAIVRTSFDHGGTIKNESVIDKEFFEKKYGKENLSCTISVMFYDAIEYGADEITLMGVFLNSREYLSQAPGIIKAIKVARESGINVIIDSKREWELMIKADEAIVKSLQIPNYGVGGYWNMMTNHPKESLFK